MRLRDNPAVSRLARDLGVPDRSDPLSQIRKYALGRVQQIVSGFPEPITDLETLRLVLANKYRVQIEFIHEDADVEHVVRRHDDFHHLLSARLREEFVEGETEGITLERAEWDPALFRYLAVIDARGARSSRAFFTSFHELTHLIVHPPQIPFPGFRRTPSVEEKTKDPIESVVDHVAAQIGFYAPVFGPLLDEALRQEGGLTFRCLDAVRLPTTPPPSLQATAMAAVNVVPEPVVFLHARRAYKKAEERALASPQATFDFAKVKPKFDLRAVMVVANETAKRSGVAIHRHIRIPEGSVIAQALEGPEEVELHAAEDQASWENSTIGNLPALPLDVRATRRGRFVYGLMRVVKDGT